MCPVPGLCPRPALLLPSPWYRDALFVVRADHGVQVYGKARIPMFSYHIPLLILAPGHPDPRRVGQPASPVDINTHRARPARASLPNGLGRP